MRVFQLLGMVLYPLIVHTLIKLDVPWLAVTGLVATSGIYLLWIIGLQRDTGAHPGWIGLYLALTVLGTVNLLTDTHYALFVPPVTINLAVGLFFAYTLRSSRTPLVEWMMRFEYGGQIPPEPVRRYARRLTWIWAVYFTAASVLALALAITAPLETWSLFVNILHFVLVGAMLALQYLYRLLRYRQYGVFMPWNTIRAMARSPWGRGKTPFRDENRVRP